MICDSESPDKNITLKEIYKESRSKQLIAVFDQLENIFLKEGIPLSVLVKMEVDELFSSDKGVRPNRGLRWIPSLIKHIAFMNNVCVRVVKLNHSEKGKRILICTAAKRENTRSTFEKLMKCGSDEYFLTDPKLPEEVKGVRQCLIKKRQCIDIRVATKILLIKDLSLAIKLDIIKSFAIRNRLFKMWNSFLSRNHFDIAVFDMDNNSLNAPIVAACRVNGIKTATIIHGCTWPMDMFVPFCADYIFVWGQFHVEQFADYIDQGNVIAFVVGNSSMRAPLLPKMQKSSILKNVGLATAAWPSSLREKILGVYLDGTNSQFNRVIKQHPREIGSLDRHIDKLHNIHIVPRESNIHDFLCEIDVLCSRESTVGLEALSYGIPIVIIDCDEGEYLLAGFLLNRFAGCPIVRNSVELESELIKLKEDSSYYTSRINAQNRFLGYLCSFFEDESAKQLNLAISRICSSTDQGDRTRIFREPLIQS